MNARREDPNQRQLSLQVGETSYRFWAVYINGQQRDVVMAKSALEAHQRAVEKLPNTTFELGEL